MLHLKVHHIGYLVKKKDAAKAAFLNLGYSVEKDWIRDEFRGIDICFVIKDGLRVELVSPYTNTSDVAGLLKRIKNSPYHICYCSADIEKDSDLLREEGYLPITGTAPAPALEGRGVRFFMHPALGMIELVREDPDC